MPDDKSNAVTSAPCALIIWLKKPVPQPTSITFLAGKLTRAEANKSSS